MRPFRKAGAATPAPRQPDSQMSVVQEEMIYGALRREALWKRVAIASMTFGAAGCIAAAVVALNKEVPAPALVPFDPATGLAVPQANVASITLDHKSAVVESMVYRYVIDRETYNQLDNDLRIKSVRDRSTGNAETSLVSLWSAGNADYPPDKYGPQARMDVQILSVTLISEDRAQVRLRKRLTNLDGTTEGLFTATLAYEFRTDEARELEAVWGNPHGFTVTEYSINSDRLETK